jgi:hypothetical protein
MDNANANILTMLKLIFPTNYPIKNNINTSYKKYLLKEGPAITFDVSDVKTMFSSGEITALGKHNYSYLKLSSGIFTVSEIIWLNDVLNNKTYRELIELLIEYNEWHKKQTVLINNDITKTTDQLQNGLTEKGDESGTGDLIIDKALQGDLISQKRIYNPDDIKQDMIKIIKKYLIPDENKTQRFNEELSNMIQYFIDNSIKNKEKNPITQLVRFKDQFDFTYKVQGEPRTLFALHKKYDGEDRKTEITKLEKDIIPKQEEINKLENGYEVQPLFSKNLVFGTKLLNQYIENLTNAIKYMQTNKLDTSLSKNETYKNELFEILNQELKYGKDIASIKVTYENEYKVKEYPNIKGNLGHIKILEELTERFADATAHLKILDEKIQKLNSEIASINYKIAKLNEPPEEIFVFDEEELNASGPKEPITQIQNDNRQKITKIQEDIFKYVITRYNRYQETKGNTELSGIYSEIDGSIDIIVDKIENLNSLVKSSAITADQILNITEPIKNSFDKLVKLNKIDIPLKIGDKLSKIIRLSNQIKFLTQFQTVFFKEPATGIFVEYENKLDTNDIFTKPAIDELKQEKYSNFKKIVDYINENFIKNNVVSLNSKLAKLLKEYIENQNNGFYDKVVEPANKLLNLGEHPNVHELEPLWDVSVTSLKSKTSGTEYNISVYMDVIEGEVNAANQSEIRCQFLDEELTRRFEELTDEVPAYGPGLNTKVFSVKKAKEEKEKHEQDKKMEIASAISNSSKENDNALPVAVPVSSGGKRHTKSFRYSSSKKNRTKKRT